MTAAASRYLELTPRGAALCAAGQANDIRRRLLRALLQREPGCIWHGQELARLLPGEQDKAPRALFDLLRDGCIDVTLSPPCCDDGAWGALRDDLDSFVAQGASLAALLDADGLLIAQAGPASEGEDPLAPPLAPDLHIHAGEGPLRATYGLVLRGLDVDQGSPLVALVRRLTRTRSPH
jgi:hypothetical protein